MSLPYWPLYISTLGNFSALEIRYWSAAIYIAPFVSSIFFSPLWGKFGDKYGYKTMIMRACVGLFITQTLILFVSDVFLIFIIRFLQGALAGFIAAAQTWALDTGPTEKRGMIMGKLQSSIAIGNLLGPLAGGLIAMWAGYQSMFSISSVICFLITVVFYFVLQDSAKPTKTDSDTTPKKVFKSLFALQKNIIFFLLAILLTQTASSMVTPIFALFVTETLKGNDMTIGVLHAATALMIFICAPIWGKFLDRFKDKKNQIPNTLVTVLFISGILQIIHAYAHTAISVFIIRLLWGVCLGAILPILIRLLVDNSQKTEKGLMIGFGYSANKCGSLAGILLGALIEAKFGYTSSFLMNGSLYFLAGILILMCVKSLQIIPDERYSLER